MGKILLIDDELAYRQHLEFLLASAGYEVRTAVNGQQALLIGANFGPDLIIIDWALRDHCSGGGIAAKLRDINPRLRTVLISGNPEIASHCAEPAGAIDEIISKPFNRACILAAVERLLPPNPKWIGAV